MKDREEAFLLTPCWQGMIYAGRPWEEAIFGAVLGEREAQGLTANPPRPSWEFKMGLKTHAQDAPRNWVVISEQRTAEGEMECIVSMPMDSAFYKLEKAQWLAKYIRELLDRARCVVPVE